MRHHFALALATLVSFSLFETKHAGAQEAGPPPQAPPPAATAPQPQAPPPAGYPPQGGYYQQQPPAGYGYYGPPPQGWYYQQPPATLPYHKDEPIPPGYRLERRPRTGLIIAGAVVTGVPYFIGLSVASAAKFENGSGFLAIPALGPWLTLAVRENSSCYNGTSSFSSDTYCPADAGVVTMLVLDALVQTTGAILFIVGIASDRELLVRQDVAKLRLTPLRFRDGGYGLGVRGGF